MNTLEERLKLLQPAPASDALRARIAHPGRRRARWARIVPMAAAAAGLIAALLLAVVRGPQGTSTTSRQAEEEFRKIGETLSATRSLRIGVRRTGIFQGEGKLPRTGVETFLDIDLKEGNRMRARLRERANPTSPLAEFLFVSDGTRMKSVLVIGGGIKNATPERPTPPDLYDRFVLALARASIAVPGNLMAIPLEDQKKSSEVSEISAGPEEHGFPTLTYRVGPYEAKLLYDATAHLPVQRTLKNPELGTFVENYRCEGNVAIDDAEFALPKEK